VVGQIVITLALALAVASSASITPAHHRAVSAHYIISIGNSSNRVRSGTIWLQSYWTGGERPKIGTITDGKTTISFSDALSPALIKPGDSYHDNWVMLIQIGAALWYETPGLSHRTLFTQFAPALASLGKATTSERAITLVLNAPSKRTITFLYLDGTPVARSNVGVALHVNNDNHCGVELGPSIGNYRTDSNGRLTFTYSAQPLALSIGHFEPGVQGWWYELITVGPQRSIVVRRNFRFPAWVTWHVTVRRTNGEPVSGALVSSYFNVGCGGPGAEANTDRNGQASLRVAPPLTGWVDVSSNKSHHQLTDRERALLEKTGHVQVTLQY
jgi:hypothetical protein